MKLFSSNFEPKIPLSWIAVLRIVVGLMFLTTWLPNFLDGVYTPDGLFRFFTEDFPQSENSLSFYAGFIDGVILPVRHLFAPFQLVAEFLLGLAILVGAFTPLASIAGIFFLINTLLATYVNHTRFVYYIGGVGTQTGPYVPMLSGTDWDHVVFTGDSDAKMAKIYVNGKLVHSDSALWKPPTTDGVYIARAINNVPQEFRGKLDDLRVYDRTLTEAEVRSLYANR